MTSVAMWKPPSRREYNPKPMDPGQVIVWTAVIPGTWATPPCYDPETNVYTEGTGRTEPVEYERIGTIWSDGPSPRTWWVLPDDDMRNPVLVYCSSKRQAGGVYDGPFWEDSRSSEWRGAIRRAENVRRRGIYAAESGEPIRSGSGPYGTYSYTCYHCDPACPEAGERDERAGGWTLHRIVDVLTGRERYSGKPPFCPRCIMLETAPETARELVTA